MIWKAVVNSFHILDSNMAWNVSSGRRLKVGEDPWMGNDQQQILSGHTI